MLEGGGGRDRLFGGTGNDVLFGDDGATLEGRWHGADLLDGGDGDDLLEGGGGDDELMGGEGNDWLWGDASEADVASGHHGRDRLSGGAGHDRLEGGGHDDVLFGGEGDDLLIGDGDIVDGIQAQPGDDVLDGGDGQDQLEGGAGDDILAGGEGADLMLGGEGDDTYRIAVGDAEPDDEGAVDTIDDASGRNLVELVNVRVDGLRVTGHPAGLELAWGEQETLLIRQGLSDAGWRWRLDGQDWTSFELVGRRGDESLTAHDAEGRARVHGSRHDDTLRVTGEGDEVAGGRGRNQIALDGVGHRLRYGLGDGLDHVTSTTGGHQVLFGRHVDRADLMLESVDGDLRLRVGPDAGDALQIDGLDGAGAAVETFAFDTGEVLTRSDLLATGVAVRATAGRDTQRGTAVADRFDRSAGDDLMLGGQGADTYAWGRGDGNDVIDDGDAGVALDRLQLAEGFLGDTTILSRDGDDLLVRHRDSAELLRVRGHFVGRGLEQLMLADGTTWDAAAMAARLSRSLTDGADSFTGTSGADVIDGRGGSDVLRGGRGNDTIFGGAGDDQLYGDAGDDVLDGGAGQDLLIGGTGRNVYHFGRGDGVDTIGWWPNDPDPAKFNRIAFKPGIRPSDIVLRPYLDGGYQGLEVEIIGTADRLLIQSFLLNGDPWGAANPVQA
jgi:Ca2+-binding RTX toxin-like protein